VLRFDSPGSTVGGCTIEESIAHIAASLNRAHKATSTVVTVVENMVRPFNRALLSAE
jgi:hypothetical protein